MTEKSVVVVIVEGLTDENAIGGLLKDYFADEEVRFSIVHGDITSDYDSSLNPKSNNYILKRINYLIEELRKKYGYKPKDFRQIIHIGDTDGAFTKGCAVYSNTEETLYYEDRIETNDVNELLNRNSHKAQIMDLLSATGRIGSIPYRFYYNSCNLEHVLYGTLNNYTNEQKEEMADLFYDQYEGKLDEFISFISDELFAVPGTYQETWKFVRKDTNSLHRYSNMHLIFRIKDNWV